MPKAIKFILFGIGITLAVSTIVYAQNQRLIEHNTIGWYVYNGDHQVSKKIGKYIQNINGGVLIWSGPGNSH